MDKKSFLRGFGIGVLFAALILGISCMMRTSDSAVIKRAREMGMEFAAEEEPLFPMAKASSGAAAGEKKKTGSSKAESTQKPSASPKATEDTSNTEKKEKAEKKNELDQEKEKMQKEFENATREFTIHAGEWSSDVSKKLEELDIISNAEDFDHYLEEYGYSDDIKAGSFEISKDASYKEIADMITSH